VRYILKDSFTGKSCQENDDVGLVAVVGCMPEVQVPTKG
jgi:hypothetical protein